MEIFSAEGRPRIIHRICVKCKVKKPLNETCFPRKISKKSGFRGICLKCERKTLASS